MNKLWNLTTLLLTMLLIGGCIQQQNTSPKPEGYPRISFPERTGYQQFEKEDCPFTFEYPNYAEIIRDTVYFDSLPPDPCWFSIALKTLNGKIYMSFKPLQREDRSLAEVLNETHTLTFKHTVKAEAIKQKPISVPKNNVNGIYYKVTGNAASPVQFFLTDSTRYFLRGALYFRNPPNADSIRPVVNFVRKDINHIINSLEWKSGNPS